MNVTLPKKEKLNKTRLAIYVASICICILSLIGTIYTLYFGNITAMQSSTNTTTLTEAEQKEQTLKTDFDNIFNNSIDLSMLNLQIKKEIDDKDIIYTKYSQTDSKEDTYSININIPYINIDSELAKEYNEEINTIFSDKVRSILTTSSTNSNSICNIDYTGNIKDNILSLIIRLNSKDGTTAQRTIIKTYNYDLENDKEITLAELIEKNSMDSNQINEKIKTSIQNEQEQDDELKSLGYSAYERNLQSNIYSVDGTEEFFISEENIYLIYSYGNTTFTNKVDIIIL